MQKPNKSPKLVFDPSVQTRYSDTYGKYLDFFASIDDGTEVRDIPASWIPLCHYLGAEIISSQIYFEHDHLVPEQNIMVMILENARKASDYRFIVEHFCTLRPELVDALWKAENQWKSYRRQYKSPQEILVTNYNSFTRPEIKSFVEMIKGYRTNHKKCVITNCSADKPYPSFVHQKIKQLYPSHELLIISGVTGIVPEYHFKNMPNYDSGIPNFWNIKKLATDYFIRNQYKEIVVFTEFNQYALNEVLMTICSEAKITFKFEHNHYTDYVIDDKYFQ